MPEKMKTPTLPQLRKLAKQKGLKIQCGRFDFRVGYEWWFEASRIWDSDIGAMISLFHGNRAQSKRMLHAALEVLPDA